MISEEDLTDCKHIRTNFMKINGYCDTTFEVRHSVRQSLFDSLQKYPLKIYNLNYKIQRGKFHHFNDKNNIMTLLELVLMWRKTLC